MLAYTETIQIPQVAEPMDRQVMDLGAPEAMMNYHLNLALILLIQVIWMIKHEVEHVKIITNYMLVHILWL
jgi:hypothetical protein